MKLKSQCLANPSVLIVGCSRKWLFEIPRNTEFYAEVTSIQFRVLTSAEYDTPCWWENRRYFEFETLEKSCLSYLRNIKTAINYNFFTNVLHIPIFIIRKTWQNNGIGKKTGIFYSKDVASGYSNMQNYLVILSNRADLLCISLSFLFSICLPPPHWDYQGGKIVLGK
jgi:hypothetical protein